MKHLHLEFENDNLVKITIDEIETIISVDMLYFSQYVNNLLINNLINPNEVIIENHKIEDKYLVKI